MKAAIWEEIFLAVGSKGEEIFWEESVSVEEEILGVGS